MMRKQKALIWGASVGKKLNVQKETGHAYHETLANPLVNCE